MSHILGNNSNKQLDTCHPDVQLIIRTAIVISRVDFGVSKGHRPPEEQFDAFKQGRKLEDGKWIVVDRKKVITNCDGYDVKGRHNKLPSDGIDIYGYVGGKANYSKAVMCYLGGLIIGVSEMLFRLGKIQSKLVWGGNWDSDGEILTDQKLIDTPHFHRIIPKL